MRSYYLIGAVDRACWLRMQFDGYGWPARFRPRSLLRRWPWLVSRPFRWHV